MAPCFQCVNKVGSRFCGNRQTDRQNDYLSPTAHNMPRIKNRWLKRDKNFNNDDTALICTTTSLIPWTESMDPSLILFFVDIIILIGHLSATPTLKHIHVYRSLKTYDYCGFSNLEFYLLGIQLLITKQTLVIIQLLLEIFYTIQFTALKPPPIAGSQQL